MDGLRERLVERLEELGPQIAIHDHETPHTYRELVDEMRRQEKVLATHDVGPQDVVVLNTDFSFPAVAALLALFLARAVVVPVVTLNETNRDVIVEHCRPRHLATLRADGELILEALPGVVGEETPYRALADAGASGLVLLSSGSTGSPKAILHNLDLLVGEKLAKRARRSAKSFSILMFLLFDHIGGINSLLSTLLVGQTAVIPAHRSPEDISALIERHAIRVLPTSPTFLNLLLIGGYAEKYDLSSLRMITYGTEPMPEELLARIGRAFPGVRLLQTFGTSETGISTTTSESSTSTFFRIENGGVEHRVVDGELQLRSATQFMGYLNYPSDAVTDDGWFRTGDLVEENADGYITIRGRAQERINVGGEKVLPLELESLLLASPLIADAMAYGKPNSITGQSVCVDVLPVGPMTRAEARRHVVEFLTGKVEPFKIPSKVSVVEATAVSERFKKKRGTPWT